jgi:hypothetical protein
VVPRRAAGASGGTPEARPGSRHSGVGSAWRGHLRVVDRALGQRDIDEAQRAWESAHLAAVESPSWEGLIETGEASLRIGDATSGRTAAEPSARRAYFAALYRACRANSFEGILRAAEAFDALGDREVVEECLGLAELQADGEQTRRQVMALVGRLGTRPVASNGNATAAGSVGAA